MKIDPYKNKEKYLKWKERTLGGIPGLSEANDRLLRQYLSDLETGLNVARGSKKGGRSYIRLNTTRYRFTFFAKHFQDLYTIQDLTQVTEEIAHELFARMRSGEIAKADGTPYLSTGDYVKEFKAFWHWYMRVNRKAGIDIRDISYDLDDRNDKGPWVYLSEDDVKRLCMHAKFYYKVLIMFLYDTGIRSPTELVNVRVGDLSEDCTELRIKDEYSKTFGRTIRLLLCPRLLREYLHGSQLSPDDQLFSVSPACVNRYLKRLAVRVLGSGMTRGRDSYSNLSMYDFRHSAACFWLPRYKSESGLKYRFGWKQSKMIHYYTEFLGMRDTITEEDLLEDSSKIDIEKKLTTSENEKAILQERLLAMEKQMKAMAEQMGSYTHTQ